MPRVMALPENRNKVDSHGPHSSRRQTRFHKKHIPRTRTCETNEGNHDPPDHVPASGALGYTFEACHGRQDLLPPFQRNWHKNHDGLWCSPYHHLVPTNTPCISRRHFRSCTFHNTCRSLGPWLFCTQKHLPALSFFAFSMCMFFTKSHSSGLASSFLHVVSNWSISCWCFFTIIWRKRLW